jgi:hypothetical protein
VLEDDQVDEDREGVSCSLCHGELSGEFRQNVTGPKLAESAISAQLLKPICGSKNTIVKPTTQSSGFEQKGHGQNSTQIDDLASECITLNRHIKELEELLAKKKARLLEAIGENPQFSFSSRDGSVYVYKMGKLTYLAEKDDLKTRLISWGLYEDLSTINTSRIKSLALKGEIDSRVLECIQVGEVRTVGIRGRRKEI